MPDPLILLASQKALEGAKALLRSKGWCQGALAETQTGLAVSPRCPDAVRYCLVGALIKACCGNTAVFARAVAWLQRALQAHYGDETELHDLEKFNDTPGRQFSEVLALYDLALQLAS